MATTTATEKQQQRRRRKRRRRRLAPASKCLSQAAPSRAGYSGDSGSASPDGSND